MWGIFLCVFVGSLFSCATHPLIENYFSADRDPLRGNLILHKIDVWKRWMSTLECERQSKYLSFLDELSVAYARDGLISSGERLPDEGVLVSTLFAEEKSDYFLSVTPRPVELQVLEKFYTTFYTTDDALSALRSTIDMVRITPTPFEKERDDT